MVLTGKTLGGDHPPFFLPVSTHVLTGPKVKRVPPPGTNWYYFFYILLSNQSFFKPFITLRVNIFLTHRPPHALQCGITTFFPDSSTISKAKVKMHLPFNLFLGCQISLYCNLQPDDTLVQSQISTTRHQLMYEWALIAECELDMLRKLPILCLLVQLRSKKCMLEEICIYIEMG